MKLVRNWSKLSLNTRLLSHSLYLFTAHPPRPHFKLSCENPVSPKQLSCILQVFPNTTKLFPLAEILFSTSRFLQSFHGKLRKYNDPFSLLLSSSCPPPPFYFCLVFFTEKPELTCLAQWKYLCFGVRHGRKWHKQQSPHLAEKRQEPLLSHPRSRSCSEQMPQEQEAERDLHTENLGVYDQNKIKNHWTGDACFFFENILVPMEDPVSL